MAFLSASSSEESLTFTEAREKEVQKVPKKVSEATVITKRSRKLPAKLREDYISVSSAEEERLQQSELNQACPFLY